MTSEVFYILLKTFNESSPTVIPLTQKLKGWTGSATAGKFFHDGSTIALLKHKDWKRDWPTPSIFLVFVMTDSIAGTLPFELYNLKISASATKYVPWDRSPSSLTFSHRGLLAVAEDRGKNSLHHLVSKPDSEHEPFYAVATDVPIASGSITSLYSLANADPGGPSSFFVNATSFVTRSIYQKLVLQCDPDGHSKRPPQILSSATNSGADFGLCHSQVESFTFPGAGITTSKHVY